MQIIFVDVTYLTGATSITVNSSTAQWEIGLRDVASDTLWQPTIVFFFVGELGQCSVAFHNFSMSVRQFPTSPTRGVSLVALESPFHRAPQAVHVVASRLHTTCDG